MLFSLFSKNSIVVPTTVTTPVVPLIITVNSVATGVNSNGIVSTKSGTTTFDPTVADTACLGKHNHIPLVLTEQSPIFQSANFSFGPTVVGNTQYVDAFQRGNFWQFVGCTDYRMLVNATVLDPITINISANDGLAIPASLFGSCGPLGVVNINTLDSIVVSKLASRDRHLLVPHFPSVQFGDVCRPTDELE